MVKKIITVILLIFSSLTYAKLPLLAPQPTACIKTAFTSTGSQFWQTVSLTLTNNCGQPVDFQNASITFQDASNVNNLDFWGNFAPLSYPDNQPLKITAQPQATGNYLASIYLHFPGTSILPANASFTILYGAPAADFLPGSVNIYLNSVVGTGQINLVNQSSKPADVTATSATVNVLLNGNTVTSVNIPWSGQQLITGIGPGNYTISPVNVSGSNNTYQGSANPSTVSVTIGNTTTSSISYSPIPLPGSINISVPALPAVLSGYTAIPTVTLTRTDTSASVMAMTNWNNTTVVPQLASGVNYTFSTPAIIYNGYSCIPVFSPASAQASATTAPTTSLNYNCSQITQDVVTFNVTGAPTDTASVNLTMIPNNGSTSINQTINLVNGQGSSQLKLADGTIYTVSASTINGYNISYSLQPLTITPNAVETITYAQIAGNAPGRIIGYLPGWLEPPTAAQLSSAGYTHIIVAFGVFSTTTPGQITPAFSTVDATYIKSLQSAGIKVLLSLGGASTSLQNTTVNFDQVLQLASSPDAFQTTFIQSLESLMTQYGFDGFDIDIESGFNAGGTFASPQGDIAILANIINTMHAKHPSLLFSMAPQTANIAATRDFSNVWANYASLIMQTANSLSWVGVQLYNTGCMLGINSVCYDPNVINSPDFSVAMATDLLANWPAKTASGQATGFQPYLSLLKPSQVVLGYVAPNASGQGDGGPIIPVATIKRAIQCLRTNIKADNSCDTFIPPAAYPGIGGVFDWQVNNDQSNNFAFAKGLQNCVLNGNCN